MPPRLTLAVSLIATAFCVVQTVVVAQDPAGPATAARSGRALLADSRTELGKLQTVRATLNQTIAISSRKMRAEGTYLRSGDDRIRLELRIKNTNAAKKTAKNVPDDSYVQVSDGQVSWRTLSVGQVRSIERCNLQEVRAAILKEPRLAGANWMTDLGIGGLKSMLASFEELMDFSAVTRKEIDGKTFLVITGRWSAKMLNQMIGTSKADGPLPGYVPDYVRIYFDNDTKFPRRLLYLKRHPEDEKRWRAIVTLDFTDVVLNAPVEASDFMYTPPPNASPADTTSKFIEQLKQAAGVGEQDEAGTQTAEN